MRRDVMILHTDLDGVGPQVVYEVIIGSTVDAYYIDNNAVNATIRELLVLGLLRDRKVYICDHSPDLETFSLLIDHGVDVYVFDHHISSELKDMSSDRVYIDLTRSATWIFYQYMLDMINDEIGTTRSPVFGKILDQFVTLVDDWDTWKHKHPESSKLNTLFYALGRDYFLARFTKCLSMDFNQAENAAISTFDRQRDNYVNVLQSKLVIATDSDGYRYGFVTAERYEWVSKAFNELIIDNKLDYIIGLNLLSGTGSLRANTKSGVNLLDITERLHQTVTPLTSRGGHKDSAGFSYPIEGSADILTFFVKDKKKF